MTCTITRSPVPFKTLFKLPITLINHQNPSGERLVYMQQVASNDQPLPPLDLEVG